MSLFGSPKIETPKEDPAIAAARARAQNQADTSLTMAIQDDLRRKMRSRLQRFGLVPNQVSQAVGARPGVTSSFMAPI